MGFNSGFKGLTLFRDYCVQQLLENRNVPIEMWDVNKHRYRTNSAFVGLGFQTKQHYRKATAYCFSAGTAIKSFRPHYGPGVDSASDRNEYQEYFLGVKAAGA